MHLMTYMVIIQQSIQLDWLNLSNLPGAHGQEVRDEDFGGGDESEVGKIFSPIEISSGPDILGKKIQRALILLFIFPFLKLREINVGTQII